jgi:hypothetical protein
MAIILKILREKIILDTLNLSNRLKPQIYMDDNFGDIA